MIKDYKELIVWQKAMDLCVLVYEFTSKYPKSELFGLTDQTRRCSVSIPSNIAEGNGRLKTTNEYKHFLSIAYASAQELETQLILAKRLKYLGENDFQKLDELLIEVLKMLNTLLYKK